MWALEADTVEYGEWKSGVRTEGTTYAMFSFTRKMGQALGGAAAAYTLGFGGYVSGKHVVQTESAIHAVKLAAGFVPAVFVALVPGDHGHLPADRGHGSGRSSARPPNAGSPGSRWRPERKRLQS